MRRIINKIKHAVGVGKWYVLSTINSLYYIVTPSNRKIIVNGYFNKILFHVTQNNFGDDINFYLLSKLSGRKVFSATNLLISDMDNIVFIGSILQKYVSTKSIVWGAGVIKDDFKLPEKPKEVRAVRGPKTRQWLLNHGVNCPPIYCDPALLLPLFYSPKIRRRYKYGIIPHYIDWNNPNVRILKGILGRNACLIDMKHYGSVKKLIDRLNECEYIISSSLHGLILSDAYRIPNIWVEFSNNVAGDGFKFHDYCMSINRSIVAPMKINELIDENVVLEKLSQYVTPTICVLPLLKSSPFPISDEIINKAFDYYGQ